MKNSQRTRTAARYDRILTKAAELFRQRGFEGVGIDDIGSAVGISGPALYRYFPNKQALLAEIISSYFQSVKAEQERLAEATKSELDFEALPAKLVIESAINTSLANPDKLVVSLRQIAHVDEPTRTTLLKERQASRQAWDSAFQDYCFHSSEPVRDVKLLAIYGVLIHLALAKRISPSARKGLATDLVQRILEANLDTSDHSSTLDTTQSARLRPKSRREALLQISTELFKERGFKGVSLRDIGQEVGIGPSAVSRHFNSKEMLLATASNRASEQLAGAIMSAIRRASSPRDAAAEIISAYARLSIECRELVAIRTTEMYFLPEPDRTVRREHQALYLSELAHMVSLARPELDPVECTARAGCAYSMINEVIMDDTLAQRNQLTQELTTLGHIILGIEA